MRCLGLLVLALLLASPEVLAEKPTILVGRIQAKIKAKRLKDRDFLETMLTTAIRKAATSYSVSSMGDLASQLEFEHMRDSLGCDTEKCLAEIAGSTGSDYVVFPKLMQRGKKFRFQITLTDRKTSTVVKSSDLIKFRWSGDRFEKTIERAVAQVFGKSESPASVEPKPVPRFEEKTIGEQASDFDFGSENMVFVAFASEPSGAVVMADGKLLCQTTPCNKTISLGRHLVSMQKERYQGHSKKILIGKGAKISWKLTPDFGWLSVSSVPAGLAVRLDDKEIGKTPVEKWEASKGVHDVLVSDPCYFDSGKRIILRREEHRRVEVSLKARQGGVRILAEGSDGNSLEAEVYIDDEFVGRTPLKNKVSVCSKTVEVKHEGYSPFKSNLSVKGNEISEIIALLESSDSDSIRLDQGDVIDPEQDLLWARCPLEMTLKRVHVVKKAWLGLLKKKSSTIECSGENRTFTWEAAQNACPGGYRLPSKKEFEILLECGSNGECKSCKASDNCKEMFDSDYNSYWSTTPGIVIFMGGYIGPSSEDHGVMVRCVRDDN